MAGLVISLQDLKEKYHLSEDQLNKEVSDEHLRAVSRIIDDHKIVGPELGLTEQEMTAINRDNETHDLKKGAMLRQWKQKYSWKATYKNLVEALLKCSRANDARRVCELLITPGAVGMDMQ